MSHTVSDPVSLCGGEVLCHLVGRAALDAVRIVLLLDAGREGMDWEEEAGLDCCIQSAETPTWVD